VDIERNIIGFDKGTNITVGISLAHKDTKITTHFTENSGHGSFASLATNLKISQTGLLFDELFIRKGNTQLRNGWNLAPARGDTWSWKSNFSPTLCQ
jgi:hypothetical protein